MTVRQRPNGTRRTLEGGELDIELSLTDPDIREALGRHRDTSRPRPSRRVIDRRPWAVMAPSRPTSLAVLEPPSGPLASSPSARGPVGKLQQEHGRSPLHQGRTEHGPEGSE